MTEQRPGAGGLRTGSRQLPIEGRLPPFAGATGWLNSPPLTPEALRGRVVLVGFWTYTCVNWRRQLPYLRAWASKYSPGLVVVGVHTPEFAFEHSADNVRIATGEMGIHYPVATDSDYAVWRAFGNHYWPALYFADTHGRIRHHHFGEDGYRQSEVVIQDLLTEAGLHPADGLVEVDPRGLEVPGDPGTLRSAETYAGYGQTENFASPGGIVPGQPGVYAAPAELGLNHWALAGNWTADQGAAVLNQAGGQISYRFHARDLNLVMGAGASGTPVRYRLRIDGRPPGASRGADTDEEGNGTVSWPRLCQLIRQPGPVTSRTFELTFLDSGARVYAFTFG
jgi:thiol-disulfide isomerase/thioredoxin